MTYLLKTCVSTKRMVAGLAHKKYLKKATNNKKKLYRQKTNILNLIRLTCQIRSDKKGKQCRSNNIEIDSPPNDVL